jgi:hypothetical protein
MRESSADGAKVKGSHENETYLYPLYVPLALPGTHLVGNGAWLRPMSSREMAGDGKVGERCRHHLGVQPPQR